MRSRIHLTWLKFVYPSDIGIKWDLMITWRFLCFDGRKWGKYVKQYCTYNEKWKNYENWKTIYQKLNNSWGLIWNLF